MYGVNAPLSHMPSWLVAYIGTLTFEIFMVVSIKQNYDLGFDSI
jgi:hypothetical protein